MGQSPISPNFFLLSIVSGSKFFVCRFYSRTVHALQDEFSARSWVGGKVLSKPNQTQKVLSAVQH
jgi:hypothetical protein